MPGHTRKTFQSGDPAQKLLDASYLNSIEKRLARLETLHVAPPLVYSSSAVGHAIALAKQRPSWHFVQLAEDLLPNMTANAYKLRWSTHSNSGDPYEETKWGTITVYELCGVKSCEDSKGIALEMFESNILRHVFIPWPLGCGNNVTGYDASKRQVLTHPSAAEIAARNPNDYGPEDCCLEWVDVINCDQV